MAIPATYTLDEIESQTGFEKRTVSYYVQQGLLPKVGRRGAKTRYPQVFIDRLLFIKMIRERQDRGEIGNLTLAEIREILDRAPTEIVADVVAGREPMDAVDVRVDPEMPPELVPAAVGSRATTIEGDKPRNGDAGMAEVKAFAAAEPMSDVIEVDMSFAEKKPPLQPVGDAAAGSKPKAEADDRPRMKGLSDTSTIREINGLKKVGPQPATPAPTREPRIAEDDDSAEKENGYPPVNEEDRLGWSLARLQKVLTDAPRRKRGNTESWHRARVTPELTISARNLSDTDAHLLDSVARILKKMLWSAWEE
jgi:DNA-binding transcriptional MerR regulator